MLKLAIATVYLLATFGIATYASTSQGCTEVTNTYYDISGPLGLSSIEIKATFSVDPDPTYLIISNISVNYSTEFDRVLCVVPNDADYICQSDFEKPLRFPLQNGTSIFHIEMIVNKSSASEDLYKYHLFSQVFDQGFFSLDTGEIYNAINYCYGGGYYDRHGRLQSSLNQCCTTFKPIEIFPKNLTNCQRFKSRTTIYNVDDNYSIFATAQVNYTVSGGNMTVTGASMGPEELKIWIKINNYESCYVQAASNKPCTFILPQGDSKFLVNTGYENSTIPVDWDGIIESQTKLVGRLFFQHGVGMITDTDPYKPQNNCQYFNSNFSPNQVVSSTFCCTEF